MITKTSEYVSTGHPDKVADFISEYILDRIIEIDPNVRYALEVQIKDYVVNLGGEITTCADVDDYNFETWAREAVKKMVDYFLTSAGAKKTKDYKCIVNGTGSYIKHSSVGDCGTTGRKLVVDFHGGRCRIGGGSPWTKDGTKADLTLNLYAHYLAKQEFEKGKGKYSCVETELSCCIGRPEVLVKIIYTLASDGSKLLKCEYTDIRPSSLIKEYKLDKPLYAERCMNGLFLNSDLYDVKKGGHNGQHKK